ncbi:MAG: hypothetical protein EBS39_13690, partial [Gammaproteobacteria bacterium]|nr:hypothetical protein [Gammaproteobacteria bacterium]
MYVNLVHRTAGALPAQWSRYAAEVLQKIVDKGETIATRKASQNAIEALAPALPELLGGSADLAASRGMKTTRVGGGHPDYRVIADPAGDA